MLIWTFTLYGLFPRRGSCRLWLFPVYGLYTPTGKYPLLDKKISLNLCLCGFLFYGAYFPLGVKIGRGFFWRISYTPL